MKWSNSELRSNYCGAKKRGHSSAQRTQTSDQRLDWLASYREIIKGKKAQKETIGCKGGWPHQRAYEKGSVSDTVQAVQGKDGQYPKGSDRQSSADRKQERETRLYPNTCSQTFHGWPKSGRIYYPERWPQSCRGHRRNDPNRRGHPSFWVSDRCQDATTGR